jgi:hypothetical protein
MNIVRISLTISRPAAARDKRYDRGMRSVLRRGSQRSLRLCVLRVFPGLIEDTQLSNLWSVPIEQSKTRRTQRRRER